MLFRVTRVKQRLYLLTNSSEYIHYQQLTSGMVKLQTLVRPELEYASSVWNPHMKCNVDKIEMVQRRAARFVCHDYSRYSHLSTLINALGWESLPGTTKTKQPSVYVLSNL